MWIFYYWPIFNVSFFSYSDFISAIVSTLLVVVHDINSRPFEKMSKKCQKKKKKRKYILVNKGSKIYVKTLST